ncbi:hypothetical protein ACQR3P_28920 [Rhodococcus sp. IEGM1300]
MINQHPLPKARTLRIGHSRKKKNKRFGIYLYTLIFTGAMIFLLWTNTGQGETVEEPLSNEPYIEHASPLIQDGIRIGEVYVALILQAYEDPTVVESEHWQMGTTSAIHEMDTLVGKLRDTTPETEAQRFHQRNAIKVYARYASGMEALRNGMMLQNEELILKGQTMIEEANQLVESIDTTIPY